MRRWILAAATLALIVMCSEPRSARAASGAALRILVAQSQGSAPIEGAAILVIDPQMSVFRREARTDASGHAEIEDLPAREYYLRVEKEMFQTHESTFTTQPGEMTQKRVVLDRFGPAPSPDGPALPGTRNHR
jgi:hypothetical protein